MPTVSRPMAGALRALLFLLALDAALKALLLLWGDQWLIWRLVPSLAGADLTPALLVSRREAGVTSLVFALLLYLAFRNPRQNVAILYAMMVGLSLGAVQSLLSLPTIEAARLAPAWMVWGHAGLRLLVAGALLYLRPR